MPQFGTNKPKSKCYDETNGSPYEKVPPEVRAWALEQFSEEEIVAGLREVRETGGLELSDFIDELEPRGSLAESLFDEMELHEG